MSLVYSLFLFFVAAVVLLYYVLPKSIRLWVVTAASLAFAAFLGFYTLVFVIVSAVLCYIGGLLAGPGRGNGARNAAAAITVIINTADGRRSLLRKTSSRYCCSRHISRS